jgi:hypothetical protein
MSGSEPSLLERVGASEKTAAQPRWFFLVLATTFGITAGNTVSYPLEKSTTTSQACLSK